MERASESRILTNDPSFTAWGWAVLNGKGEVLAIGCIQTKPEHKKTRVRVSDDRTRRAIEIVQELLRLIAKYKINYIVSESPHGSQNASAAVMIGIVAGILAAIGECLQIPVEYYSEQDSKKALLGKKAATKDDMIEAIDRVYEVAWHKVKYFDEAVADALAVHYVASKQSQILKMMRQ